MNKKVILCGYNWTGCKALSLLLELNYEVFVYTHESPYYVSSLIDTCNKLNVRYSTEKISIKNLPFIPDLIVSIYYRYIISDDIINIVNNKIFNLHPSLLPAYAGCSSLTWAMINNEDEVGFSYHYLTSIIDGGNIIYQRKIKIEKWDTQQTLYDRVMFESMKSFSHVLQLVNDKYVGTPQSGEPSYFKRGCPLKGKISSDWDIEKKERFIRAMIFPPLPLATNNGIPVTHISEIL